MKPLLFFALIASSFSVSGQIVVEMPYDTAEQKIMFREVIDVPGKTKDQIFVIARSWTSKIFNDADKAIDYEDKEAGVVSGKVRLAVFTKAMVGSVQSTVDLSFKIEVKDEKLRYTFTNFSHRGFPSYPINHGAFEDFYFSQKGLYKKNLITFLSQTKDNIDAAIKMLNDDLINQDDEDW